MISNFRQHARHEPLYDIDPRTGASIEVFYADRALETFGRRGVGWLVLAVASARLFARRPAYGSIRYELLSVSARDEYTGHRSSF